ncbi:MAG: precorrin-8X methylmutase [Candidatus Margulisiibacteriota bacterium]
MATLSDPKEIEALSFRIVSKYFVGKKMPRLQKEVVKRVLHATSDPDYIEDIIFHSKAIKNALTAIKNGENVIVDASMVRAGINKKSLSTFGCKIICFLNRKDVVRQAPQLNITRSALAMRKACKLMERGIVAIGNAPTALLEVCDLVSKGKARPALIIGLPVGFVGAKENSGIRVVWGAREWSSLHRWRT